MKINFFHGWKCIILGAIRRSRFWHLRRKPSVIFSKWLFFQNSLVISWPQGNMQVKNKTFFECFTINNCEYTFVTFYGIQSLPWRLHRSVFRKNLVQWQFNPIHKYIATVPIHLTFDRGRERLKIMIGSFLCPLDSQICLKFDVVNPLFISQNASMWTGWCGSVVSIGAIPWLTESWIEKYITPHESWNNPTRRRRRSFGLF